MVRWLGEWCVLVGDGTGTGTGTCEGEGDSGSGTVRRGHRYRICVAISEYRVGKFGGCDVSLSTLHPTVSLNHPPFLQPCCLFPSDDLPAVEVR